jgi:hypothetical protein
LPVDLLFRISSVSRRTNGEGLAGEGLLRYRLGRNGNDHKRFVHLAQQIDRRVGGLNVSD